MQSSEQDNSLITAWSLIEPYCDAVSIYDGPEIFLEGFSKLPVPSRHLFAVHWCDSEICNGGFLQFFENSTGILAPEALDGFQAIGAHKCLALLDQAMSMFDQPYPRDRAERQNCLAKLYRRGDQREEWDPFYTLDDPYLKAKADDHLSKLMDVYAQIHAPRR